MTAPPAWSFNERMGIHSTGFLAGTVGIVTGAGQGIGLGIATALAKEGMDLVLVDLAADTVRATAAGLAEQAEVRCRAVVGDVSVEATAAEAVQAAGELGGLDALVNNAQVHRPNIPFQDHADDDLRVALDTGLWGTFRFMRAAHPRLAEGGGAVVNIASSAGTHGLRGFAGYAAAKEGIRGLTKVAALEWGGDGITVNALCPAASSPTGDAYFAAHPERAKEKAALRPIPRNGDPEHDIGRTVAFLVGPDARFITGMTVMVNGGMTICP